MSFTSTLYYCPGEKQPISREIHLGRLASFFPKCRQCPSHRDTGSLPKPLVQLLEGQRSPLKSLFLPEGIGGVYLDPFSTSSARQAAAAFGLLLRDTWRESDPSTSDSVELNIVLAGDGRPHTPEILAAVCDGLRWSGCEVIELATASAPCLVTAMRSRSAAGAVLVGNAGGRPATSELRFWQDGGRPLSSGDGLDALEARFLQRLDRPTRAYAGYSYWQGADAYLAGFAEHFHALRPLRFVIDTSCRSLIGYLRGLIAAVGCKMIYGDRTDRSAIGGLASRVVEERADFGLWVDGDGEACRLFDERGRETPAEQILTLLAADLLARQPGGVIVVEHDAQTTLAPILHRHGSTTLASLPSRAAMYRSLLASEAALGGGRSGRFWFGAGQPVADALRLLAELLTIFSRDDRPVSEVFSNAFVE
jgi:phosphomannomutase